MKTAYWIAGATALTMAVTSTVALAATDDAGGKRQGKGPRISFEQLDTNADGKITPEEMEARAAARFAEADADGDGKLTAEELQASFKRGQSERASKMSARMLERRDANNDGVLTLDEMRPKDGGRFFERFDTDNDGAVSAEEFASMEKKRMGRKGKRHGGGDGAPD